MGCCGARKSRPSRRTITRIRKPISAQQVQAQREGKPVATFLMCRPKYYGINYSINPWMDINNSSDRNKAVAQWNSLEAKIVELGAVIRYVPPRENLPDMVFTANAGLILQDRTVIVSTFKHEERQGEETWFEKWFVDEGFSVKKLDAPFEGAGDALYLKDQLVAACGFRSARESYVKDFKPDLVVELIDPHFYHLDTCFCPLRDNDYMIFPGAFTSDSLESIRAIGREITIPEYEARRFACNAVRIGDHVILPDGCPETMALLQKNGYNPHPIEMSEFLLSGGACKCLTLRLE